MPGSGCTTDDLKVLIVESLKLDSVTPNMIDDDTPLFGEGLGLDSVDALELVVAIEKAYQVKIVDTDNIQAAFRTVSSLAEFVRGLGDELTRQTG